MRCITSGRRYEARFAWNAALVTAEDEVATRVKAKLAIGSDASQRRALIAHRARSRRPSSTLRSTSGASCPTGGIAIETIFAFCTTAIG